MKCRPPFLLYSKINSHRVRSSSGEKYGNKLNEIFSRIPGEIIRKNPEIEKIVNPEPKILYDVINHNKKPKLIEITGNMREAKEKMISNLNDFREMLYDFNQEGKELLSNFENIQEENFKFSKVYKKIQKDKSKFNTGTYLDHEYLIGVASKYAARGIKVPKIGSDKSVFSGNPLILGGSELEDFIVYNLGDRKKSDIFLEKVENLVRKKETGNYLMSDIERKRLEFVEKNEKPKGYIEPEILIPQLKKDISLSQKSYNNLESFEKFFENKKKISIINNSRRNSMRNQIITKNNSYNNIFDYTNIKNPKKVVIKNNLSFLKNLKNNSLNNKYSNISTAAILSQKPSTQNSRRIVSYKNFTNITKSNVSSAISRRQNSRNIIMSPLPSHTNRSSVNKINSSILNNIFSAKKRKFIYEDKNFNNIVSKNNRIFSGISEITKNDIFSVNNFNKIKKRNVIIARNNSIDRLKVKVKEIQLKNADQFNTIDVENNKHIIFPSNEENTNEEKSEENELKIINDELEGEKEKKNDNTKINTNIDLFDNNENKNEINTNIKDGHMEDDINLPLLKLTNDLTNDTLDQKVNKEDDNLTKTEKIYKSVLGDGYKSRRLKVEITDFLKSKGYEVSKNFTNKEAYKNFLKMKNKMGERNYLLEEYNIRGGESSKKFLSSKQKSILNQNDNILKKIEDNEYKYKKILLEKYLEKNWENYEI